MSMSPPYSKEYHRRRKEVLLRARDCCKCYGIVFSGHELTTPVDSWTELANDQGSQHWWGGSLNPSLAESYWQFRASRKRRVTFFQGSGLSLVSHTIVYDSVPMGIWTVLIGFGAYKVKKISGYVSGKGM